MKKKNLKIMVLLMMFLGIILMADELLGLHYLGDLSNYDPTGSELVKHWMLGLAMVVSSFYIWRKKLEAIKKVYK